MKKYIIRQLISRHQDVLMCWLIVQKMTLTFIVLNIKSHVHDSSRITNDKIRFFLFRSKFIWNYKLHVWIFSWYCEFKAINFKRVRYFWSFSYKNSFLSQNEGFRNWQKLANLQLGFWIMKYILNHWFFSCLP